MKNEDIWVGQKYDFKKSEIKICGDTRIRITYTKENIEGYKLKYELSCIDIDGKAFKQFIYKKIEKL